MPHYSADQEREWKAFVDAMPTKTDDELRKLCELFIWLSAYASYNPRSNYHRMSDYCHDECTKRGKPEIYREAHETVRRSLA